MRRALAVLAAVPLILFAAACGSDDGASTSASSTPGASAFKVGGNVGAKPSLVFPAGSPATTSSYAVIQPGAGNGVKAGDRVIVNLTVYNWDGKDNAVQGSSYDTKRPETIAVDEQIPQVLQEGFTKVKNGGRLLAVLANDAAAPATPADSTKVFVFDVVGTQPPPLKAATGKETKESLKGVKVVNPGGEKAPTLTTKTDEKPSDKLVVKTLIEGTGPKVQPSQTLTVHYTGKIWGSDKQFDSSWERGEPAEFPLAQVIQGWQQGLAGVPVGSRVVMSIPPDLGYGDQEQQGIPAKSTLVFVVDVLAAY
ncbi:FKBP-type peptidyl-prolyl cis-trans isomerase [Nonomuraea phyllanthi]|uniref:Peptidyl-prolyl cis-trans isomerase n=1 Tax=Nonomuraea phyllanthi TaxID=2219224 RepID=A0A5C4WNC6_9ACTN|nr:FKBP-type peptidyl-prolyl cis-trans isomerase [Nonomuraea phyllanthi]KAB8195231.1 FKBP-type peptidyl-prolyl cis-trans isomerase [Nonomuraea phyllanthi]QFY10638.1 FKBP-type peptidyl-prolyl cis-trans isomerase [Nonomuraea phyllanthi]